MPYGYEPLNYIPDYSYIAKAGQQLGNAVEDFSDKWSAHKKEEETLRNNRAAADDFYSSLKSQGTQALIDMGFAPEDAEARMQNIKPLSDVELQNPTLGWERIKNDFAMISKSGEKAIAKRGQEELSQQFTTQRTLPEDRSMPLNNTMPIDESGNEQFGPPKPINGELPTPTEQMGPPVPTLTPPPSTREELYRRPLSPEARAAAKDDVRVNLLPENEDAIADKELTRRSKNLAAQKTEAEVRELNRRASGTRSSSAADRNADTNAASLEETKRVNRIKDLDAQIKAAEEKLKEYSDLPDDPTVTYTEDKGLIPGWKDKKVPNIPPRYYEKKDEATYIPGETAYKGDVTTASGLRKELTELKKQRQYLSAGGTVATLPGAPARKPSKPVDPEADIAQAKRLLAMKSDGKGNANPHYKPNPTPADVQAMVDNIRRTRQGDSAYGGSTPPVPGRPSGDSQPPVMSPEEVRAAPSGTRYRTVDGRTGTKP